MQDTTGEPARILIVDDNEANVRLLDLHLRNAGYRTEKAYDGEQALEKVRQADPDLVLLDVMMPKLDGYEVCRRLRADDATNVVPVIMITALTGVEDRIRGLDCGADDFISKPFDKGELLARVRNLLRVKYYRSMIAERQKFDAVIEDLNYGIIVTDGDLKATVVSRQAQVLLGRGGEECPGRDLLDLFQGFIVVPDAAALRGDTERATTVELEREDTSPGVYLRGRLTRIFDPGGALTNVAFVFRDVSEERRAEKLQRDFLSLVSHKLKTPLTIVSGYMRLISAGKYGEMSPEMAKAFGLVEARAEDLKILIEKLLQYAGLSAEELRHEAVVVDLGTVVERSVRRITDRYGSDHVEVETDLPADLPRLHADVEQLALVLDNLLDNAVKFTADDRATARVAGRRGDAGMVEVTVRDFGSGIPYKNQADVFSDFQQVDDAFTGNVRGLGLGLPTAKRLVENWGGTIRLDSRPGEGSSFTFTVPEAPAAGDDADRPAPEGGPAGHMETA